MIRRDLKFIEQYTNEEEKSYLVKYQNKDPFFVSFSNNPPVNNTSQEWWERMEAAIDQKLAE